MTPIKKCPDAQRLRDLVACSLPGSEALELEEHLNSCKECLRRLQHLDDGCSQTIGRHLKDSPADHELALAEMIANLKAQTVENVAAEHEACLSCSLDFLEPSDNPDSIGRFGPYEISQMINRGGMGVVLRGHDSKLSRVAAIKVLAPELASNPTAHGRFLREAQAAAAVSHDHVVTIHAVNEAEGLPYLVMEYVDGESLQEKIGRAGMLDVKEVLRIGMQTASGLSAAHAQGLVHRDIKPSNILLENSVERVKITDFGLARAVDDVRITRTGVVAGTPQYMSPEQARGESVDHRSDLFSLGGVMYAMCTGRPPFRAESTVGMIHRVCEDTPRPIQQINPEVPDWLVEIIARLLNKDPQGRFQSAAEVSQLLAGHLAHLQQPAVNPQPPRLPQEKQWVSSSRGAWLVAICAVFLLVAGLGFMESSGVTNVTGTVIRLVQGEGTLVIDVDDPDIEVAIDGVDLVISGGGLRRLRVPVGPYKVEARKNGKTIRTQVVTITRDGRQIVKVRREETPPPVLGSQLVWQDVVDWGFSGQVSPDGRYVSYVDWATGNLGVRDLDTATSRLLTDTIWPKWRFHSIFSPDGQQIAYQFGPERGQFAEVRTVGVDGTDPRQVFAGEEIGASPVAWSPNGNHVLAILGVEPEHENQKRQLALISVGDGSPHILKTLQAKPQRPMSFSPDGEYIAYSHAQQTGSVTHRDISLLATDGTHETPLIQHPADDYVLGWTPDGNGLVFASDRNDILYAYTISIVDGVARGEARMATKLGPIVPMGFTNDGSLFYGQDLQLQNIYTATVDMDAGDVQTRPTLAFPFHAGHQSAPDWSPDGKSLACRSLRQPNHRAFLVRSKETGESRELVPVGRPTRGAHSLRWSPDGHSFLYGVINNVLQMDVKTRKVTVLLPEETRVLDADWSRDSKAIFYVEDTPDTGDLHRIVRRQLDSGMETELCRIAEHVLWLTVSPNGQRLALLTTETGSDERAVILIPATGGEPQELMKLKGIQRTLAWTIDGRYLLYGLGEKNTELWRVTVEGGMRKKLGLKVAGYMQHLRVHPDGKQIAFNVQTGRSELWVMENFLASLAVDQ